MIRIYLQGKEKDAVIVHPDETRLNRIKIYLQSRPHTVTAHVVDGTRINRIKVYPRDRHHAVIEHADGTRVNRALATDPHCDPEAERKEGEEKGIMGRVCLNCDAKYYSDYISCPHCFTTRTILGPEPYAYKRKK